MHLCPFHKDPSLLGSGAHLPQHDLILTNYICNDLISK